MLGETADTILELLLARVQKEGATLVVATHDPEIAARFDRTVNLADINEVLATRPQASGVKS